MCKSVSGYQGIPPRGKFPNKLREKIQAVNDSVAARIGDIENVQFYAVDASLFVQADGSISPSDMYDFLHMTASGCQKLAEPLVDELESILKNFMTSDTLSQGDIMTS